MYITLNNDKIFVATGGKEFDANLPTVVFLHGSALDHRSWALQSRWFSFHGYSVLAPDFPGHSLSAGRPLQSIEEMAQWICKLLDEVSVQSCCLVGHSQGALVAMEAASQRPNKVKSMSIIASAAAIPVNEHLLKLAESNLEKAVDAMLTWGFGERYQFGLSAVPGQAPIGTGIRIMQSNPLYADLTACNNYNRGNDIARSLSLPTQLILARQDKMTPEKSGRALGDLLPNVQSLITLEKVGHMLPIEAPDQCLLELRQFISTVTG